MITQLRKDRLALALAALILLVGITGGIGAADRVDKPFPGFLVLANGVVPSVGLSIWPATQDGALFQTSVLTYDHETFTSAAALQSYVDDQPLGSQITYRFGTSDHEVLTRSIETRSFGWRDFGLLYGFYLANGIALAIAALCCVARRHASTGACAAGALMGVSAVWALSALDLYGPYRMFRLHAFCEAMLFPAALHMAINYPMPARRASAAAVPVIYAVGLMLAGVMQLRLMDAAAYSTTHLIAVTAFGLALASLVASELGRLRASDCARFRAAIVPIVGAALVALSLPVALCAVELLTGGRSPQNAMALTAALFPIAVAYTVLRDAQTQLALAAD